MSTDREPLTQFEQAEAMQTIDRMKAILLTLGYTIHVDEDGSERIIRPDGTTAVIAKKEKK